MKDVSNEQIFTVCWVQQYELSTKFKKLIEEL